jgi:hypothetical protein
VLTLQDEVQFSLSGQFTPSGVEVKNARGSFTFTHPYVFVASYISTNIKMAVFWDVARSSP